MKSIKVRETKGHRGRTYFAGKHYKTVDREAVEDDEINKHHAAEMVALELADAVKARATRPKRAAAKRNPAAKRKATVKETTAVPATEPKPAAEEK
jgi:hypothetical protein